MGPTRSLANYWGKKKNIGHVSNFDWNILMRWWWQWWWWQKNEVRSQQVPNSWQFGIYSYSYTQPCVWDIFLWIVYLNSYPNNIFLWRTRSHKCCGCLFSPWWYQVYHSLHFPNGHGCISRPSLFVSIRYQLNLRIWCHNHVYQIWVYM